MWCNQPDKNFYLNHLHVDDHHYIEIQHGVCAKLGAVTWCVSPAITTKSEGRSRSTSLWCTLPESGPTLFQWMAVDTPSDDQRRHHLRLPPLQCIQGNARPLMVMTLTKTKVVSRNKHSMGITTDWSTSKFKDWCLHVSYIHLRKFWLNFVYKMLYLKQKGRLQN